MQQVNKLSTAIVPIIRYMVRPIEFTQAKSLCIQSKDGGNALLFVTSKITFAECLRSLSQ